MLFLFTSEQGKDDLSTGCVSRIQADQGGYVMTQVFYPKPYLLEPMQRSFKGRSIVSMEQITAEDLYHLFAVTHHMKHIAVNKVPSSLLAGHVVSLLFFEPSSRT